MYMCAQKCNTDTQIYKTRKIHKINKQNGGSTVTVSSTEMSLVELLQSTQDLARCRSLDFDITHDMTP